MSFNCLHRDCCLDHCILSDQHLDRVLVACWRLIALHVTRSLPRSTAWRRHSSLRKGVASIQLGLKMRPPLTLFVSSFHMPPPLLETSPMNVPSSCIQYHSGTRRDMGSPFTSKSYPEWLRKSAFISNFLQATCQPRDSFYNPEWF